MSFVKNMFRAVEPGRTNGVIQAITKTQLKNKYIAGGLVGITAISAGLSLKDGYTRNRMGKVYSDSENNLSNVALQSVSPTVQDYQKGIIGRTKNPISSISSSDDGLVDGALVMSLHNMR